ncbi:class I SAM-dependent methyltransferase [Streptomyces sp. NPDC053086]|uniref:class I SAM-dependent methyltransferase n=1 Tax=unclassified Streptomyces TaxID=2593676 RepID=UPI0037D44895
MISETGSDQLHAMASTAGYGEAAEALAEQYESVTFNEVHREVLHLFPSRPSSVLDVGAGSGRDAAALAARGHRVVAAEPTAELRALGQRLHAGQGIEWVDDALPELPELTRTRTPLRSHPADRSLDAPRRTTAHLGHGPVPARCGPAARPAGASRRLQQRLRHGHRLREDRRVPAHDPPPLKP